MLDLALAIGHHLLIFLLFGVLVAELVLVRTRVDLPTVARIDLWYGIVAAAILAVGFTRAIFAAKGWDYYEHNIYFWAKITTFVVIGFLSIPPTMSYLRRKRADAGPSASEIAFVRRFL